MIGREADPVGDVRAVAEAARRQDLDRHERGLVREPGDADAVVRDLGDRAGHVGAVPVVVERLGPVVDEVPALGEARALQVLDLLEALAEVAVRDARVDDRHRDAAAPAHVPGLLGVHLLHVPLVLEVGVVRVPERVVHVEGLGGLDLGALADPGQQRGEIAAVAADGDPVVGPLDRVELEVDAPVLLPPVDVGLGRPVVEVHDQPAGLGARVGGALEPPARTFLRPTARGGEENGQGHGEHAAHRAPPRHGSWVPTSDPRQTMRGRPHVQSVAHALFLG